MRNLVIPKCLSIHLRKIRELINSNVLRLVELIMNIFIKEAILLERVLNKILLFLIFQSN